MSEHIQRTLRMMQRSLECYVKFQDVFFLHQYLYWSGLNAQYRALLMQALEA